ncbi:MAG: efflux RND transporter periplasmic adaptor subunit [Pseudomonadota bacterium]
MRVLPAIVLCLTALTPAPLWAQEASPVRVATPEERGLTEQLLLTGTLTARQDANLSSRSEGLVAELLVDVGDQVTRGQPLLMLDAALAGHELAQRAATRNAAKVLRDDAQRQVREAELLAEQQLFPQTELEQRRAALAQYEAAFAQAEAAYNQQQEVLDRHTLTAPFDGVIAARSTDVGEYVSLGTPVLQLVALDPLLLDVQIPQEYYPALERLGTIAVQPDLEPGRELTARLLAAVPVGDAAARSFQARLQVEGGDHLLPGTSAQVTLNFSSPDERVFVVPPDALLRHADGNYSVFTVRENTAFRRLVSIGRSNELGVEILNGLDSMEPVVVRGNEILRDGQAVRVIGREGE